MKYIVQNKVTCLSCGEILISYSRYDYKTCKCPNETMVDGGLDYQRYGGADMSLVKPEVIYNTDDFNVVRQALSWGTYGKDGKGPYRRILLCDMELDHILAVIEIVKAFKAEWMIDLYNKEITFRNCKQNKV